MTYPRQYDFYSEYKYFISNSAENPFDDYPQPKQKIIEWGDPDPIEMLKQNLRGEFFIC